MSQMSAGKAGAMKHNSGNVTDNHKKGKDAGRKGARRYVGKGS
jgi:hypothetical protein